MLVHRGTLDTPQHAAASTSYRHVFSANNTCCAQATVASPVFDRRQPSSASCELLREPGEGPC